MLWSFQLTELLELFTWADAAKGTGQIPAALVTLCTIQCCGPYSWQSCVSCSPWHIAVKGTGQIPAALATLCTIQFCGPFNWQSCPSCSYGLTQPRVLDRYHITSSTCNLHRHLSLNQQGHWGSRDDFTTSFLHFSLFSTALWDFANSRPVHSLMLSSHLFLCLPCLLLCLAGWFWPDLMNRRRVPTSAVCFSLHCIPNSPICCPFSWLSYQSHLDNWHSSGCWTSSTTSWQNSRPVYSTSQTSSSSILIT